MLDDPGGSAPVWPAQPHRPELYDAPVYIAPPVEMPSLVPRQRLWPAILTLLLLGGLIPETIATSNTPLVAYLANPALLLFLCAFYGCAALLLRDAWRARNLGWASVILLGVSFGAMNEGVIAGTWWKIPAKGYTLTGGVNWGWATALTMFHVVYSMVISILVVELLFPRIASSALAAPSRDDYRRDRARPDATAGPFRARLPAVSHAGARLRAGPHPHRVPAAPRAATPL